MKKGFTLVELLVVVLIIGILAAVALPQYQKAVEKTRYAGLMPMAASVKTAQEAFYLADSSYSPSLEYLDVRVPGEVSGGSATLKDGTHVQVNADGQHDYVKTSHDSLDNTYVLYFNKSANYPGEVHCEALSSSERAKSLCKNMGGEELGNATTSGYTAYVLSGSGNGNSNSGGGNGGDPADDQNGPGNSGSSTTSSGVSLDLWDRMGVLMKKDEEGMSAWLEGKRVEPPYRVEWDKYHNGTYLGTESYSWDPETSTMTKTYFVLGINSADNTIIHQDYHVEKFFYEPGSTTQSSSCLTRKYKTEDGRVLSSIC